MPNTTLLKVAGYGSLAVAFSHAAAAKQFMNLRAFQELPNIAYTRSTIGWYQGSGFLILTGMSCPLVKHH
ncbi:hypothetical protein N7533_008204 [Penicillium manginii]|uniref:uncharacterized protein n=1 Tax=Penicillium manginii TaxID=203109 RepID=UPI0025485665|nr:uncharacterized protein N7533_008204 [Penicillium manginii]KAJ5751176.1 hypothetical protein N7533_008204 [Penicillium manginii]